MFLHRNQLLGDLYTDWANDIPILVGGGGGGEWMFLHRDQLLGDLIPFGLMTYLFWLGGGGVFLHRDQLLGDLYTVWATDIPIRGGVGGGGVDVSPQGSAFWGFI